MKPIQISDFKIGHSIQGFYLCKEKHLRHTRSGDLFLDMIFSDSTGTIPGKLWDLVDQFQDRFESGDPVAVKGKITEFNDQLQIKITLINHATDGQYKKYGFSTDLLIRKVEEPVDVLWERLYKIINILSNPYKTLIQSIFREHEQKIKTIPRSIHPYPVMGGLLKHLVITSEMSLNVIPYYSTLDKDLILCGILLYDIGKVESINDDLQAGYTDSGRLIGHVALGIDILKKAALSLKNFPEDILLNLEHIILSNKSGENASSLRVPQFPEALFVHYMIALDCQINLMQDALETTQN